MGTPPRWRQSRHHHPLQTPGVGCKRVSHMGAIQALRRQCRRTHAEVNHQMMPTGTCNGIRLEEKVFPGVLLCEQPLRVVAW